MRNKRDRNGTESGAYGRILATASDLFYRNGYRATGINEIIDKSGVAKATFYAHFPSKELLALAYVKSMNDIEGRELEKALEKYRGPYDKLLGIVEYLIPWSRERDYRGCGYMNVSSEVPDPGHPLRRESQAHYDGLRALVGLLMKDLKAQRGAAWKDRDADQLADSYMLIFAGALAMAQLYHDPKPLRHAWDAARKLLS